MKSESVEILYQLVVQGVKILLSVLLMYMCITDPTSGSKFLRIVGVLMASFIIFDAIDRVRCVLHGT